jgi:acyl-CoA thioester hydrolase
MARFVYDVHMRWSDMDAYRHVNNVAYLRYLEMARIAMFFLKAAHSGRSFEDGVLIGKQSIEYLAPVVYDPQPLRIELWIDDVSGASFDVKYEVYDHDKLVARAVTTQVRYNFVTARPQRLDHDELAFLALFADEKLG